MIKKLQALKAKKGFTLVELVVVIAIIGVLAAILIPVMIGVVQDANITNADTLAKQIYSNTQTFCTKADTAKNPLRGVGSSEVIYVLCAVSGGDWTITAGISTDTTNHGTVTIDDTTTPDVRFGDATKYKFDGGTNATDTEKCLDAYLADVLRDFTDGAAAIFFSNGACVGACVVQGGTTADLAASASGSTSGLAVDMAKVLLPSQAKAVSTWDGKAGVLSGGVIVGTSPKIAMS